MATADKTICLQAVKANGEELDRLITSRIEQALQIWDADKIGIPDYALESAGDYLVSQRSNAKSYVNSGFSKP